MKSWWSDVKTCSLCFNDVEQVNLNFHFFLDSKVTFSKFKISSNARSHHELSVQLHKLTIEKLCQWILDTILDVKRGPERGSAASRNGWQSEPGGGEQCRAEEWITWMARTWLELPCWCYWCYPGWGSLLVATWAWSQLSWQPWQQGQSVN